MSLMHALIPGAMGLNQRNRDVIARYNPPRLIALANDKIASKRALVAYGIATPASIRDLSSTTEIDGELYALLAEEEHGFVVKPSRGSQGHGVTLFSGVHDGKYLPLHGEALDERAFEYMIARLLSGEYTKGHPGDRVIIEKRILPTDSWGLPHLPGAPDLRVIVFKGEPVMAMLRLPTIASQGRANLHKGGIGLGIDLATGKSIHAIWNGQSARYHPDTGDDMIGRPIEALDECINISRRCAEAVHLGYLGVDLMLDRQGGPCVVEINARAGLAIQVANQRGFATAFAPVDSGETWI